MNLATLRPGQSDILFVECDYSGEYYTFWTHWKNVDFWQWEIDDDWGACPFPLLPPIMGPCVPPRRSHAR